MNRQDQQICRLLSVNSMNIITWAMIRHIGKIFKIRYHTGLKISKFISPQVYATNINI